MPDRTEIKKIYYLTSPCPLRPCRQILSLSLRFSQVHGFLVGANSAQPILFLQMLFPSPSHVCSSLFSAVSPFLQAPQRGGAACAAPRGPGCHPSARTTTSLKNTSGKLKINKPTRSWPSHRPWLFKLTAHFPVVSLKSSSTSVLCCEDIKLATKLMPGSERGRTLLP